MQHQQQHVLARAILIGLERKQLRPQRRLACKIKPTPRRTRQRLLQVSLAHLHHSKPRTRRIRRQNLLPRNPQHVREDRAQALVPRNDVPQRCRQRRAVESAHQPDRQRDRIGRALMTFTLAFQPVQEPQPALRIRQRHLVRTQNRTQGRTTSLRPLQPLHQRRNRRRLEQAADRDLNVERRADAADQPRRQKRMAPEREEVVVDAHTLQPQNLRKQTAQHLLLRRARTAHGQSRHLRRRQRTAVELAVGRERKPLQHHIGRRHHVVRKPRSQMRTQLRNIGRLIRRPPPHRPPAACCRARPRAQSPPPAQPPHAAPAPPRSRPARCGTRAA